MVMVKIMTDSANISCTCAVCASTLDVPDRRALPVLAVAAGINVSVCADAVLHLDSLCSGMLSGLCEQGKRGSCSPSVQQHDFLSVRT